MFVQEENMKFRPLHDRILVRRVESDERTKGGIIIPDTAKEKPQPGRRSSPSARAPATSDGERITALEVKAGRYRAVRQVVGHRSQDRRRRAAHYEREPTSWASSKARKPRSRSRRLSVAPGNPINDELIERSYEKWLPRK
jgi:co-chaperonin GroES (HSP10)